MNVETQLTTAIDLLQPWTTTTERPETARCDVLLARTDLHAAVAVLQQANWGYLAAITGLDLGSETAALEVLYQFCAGAAVLTLRVQVPYAGAAVDSVCDLIPSASFFERELQEMFGIQVVGTPNPDRLFLPDNWPEELYPLRKNFVISGLKDRCLVPLSE